MSKYILAYMDFMSITGFSSVSHNVLDRMTPFLKANDIKVDMFALNFGLKEDFDYNEQIKVLNPSKFEGTTKDPFARMGLLRVLAVGAYDLLWMMNDISVIAPMMVHVDKLRVKKEKEGRTPFKVLFYTPIDSYPLPSHFPTLKNIEQIVTYTKYGKKAMDECFEKMDVKPVSKIDVIPHGMDTKVFKPLDNKMELREKYKLPTDAILFGNINKNQPRKDIGTTLIAFAQVKKQNPKEKYALYLHCYHSDHAGINLYRACERLDLKVGKDVFFPTDARYLNAEYTPIEINEIYNCFDVFVNTTMSEGWGLTLTEAMCVGLPIVCPLHTSLSEITDNGRLTYSKITLYEHFQMGDAEYVRFKSDPKDVMQMMLVASWNIKNNKEDLFKKYQRKFVEYNWDNIAKQFEQHIKNLL